MINTETMQKGDIYNYYNKGKKKYTLLYRF